LGIVAKQDRIRGDIVRDLEGRVRRLVVEGVKEGSWIDGVHGLEECLCALIVSRGLEHPRDNVDPESDIRLLSNKNWRRLGSRGTACGAGFLRLCSLLLTDMPAPGGASL